MFSSGNPSSNSQIYYPLLLLVARACEEELVPYAEYLKAENRVLRSKLPKRIEVTSAGRVRLVKLGERLGLAIKELILRMAKEVGWGRSGS